MSPSSQPNDLHRQQADDLQATRKLLRATLDSSMDMIQVFEAVRTQQGEIVDFKWVLNNHTAEKIYGDVIGKSLLQYQPGVVDEGIFAAFTQVVESGVPQQYEKHYVHEQFDGWFHQSVVRLDDGVATTTTNITSRKRAEEQLQRSHGFLQSVIDSSLDIIQVFKAVRDETGRILDFVWVINNQKAVTQNGDVIGKSLLELNPGVVPSGIFDNMVTVVQTGLAHEHEQYYVYEQFDGWFYQALVKTDDGVTMTTRDISRQKQAEQEILRLNDEVAQRATDKYRILFETIDEGFAVQELVFDHCGEIADLIYHEANAAFARHTGLSDANGKRASEVFPHIEQGWFDALKRVYQTGVSERIEGFNMDTQRWITAHYSRVGGSGSPFIAAVFQDITERKQHQRQQDYLLILSDALRSIADSIAIEETVTRIAMQEFAADRCYYCRIEAGQAIITRDAMQGDLPSVAGTYPMSSFALLKNVVDAGQPFVVDNAATTPILDEAIRAICLQLQVISFMNVPVMKNGQAVGVLCTVQSTPRHWTQAEIQLAIETAERTWAAVERARTEEALRESQKRFESIANLVPDLLWDSEPGGSTNWYNQRWLEYTGQRFEEAIGWGWIDAIHPDDREGSARRYRQAVAASLPLRQEHRIRRHDGVYRWFVVNASPLRDETGQVINMYGAATDIHESKRLEATLREADRRKDEFLAMLAHELRNPMATLRSGLAILNLTITDERASGTTVASTVAMMERQTDHLVRMVDDLLDVSRISRGKIELHTERVNLVALVQQTAEGMRTQFEQQGKSLQVSLPDAAIELEADATRLSQVVTNLLTNGLRYTGEHGQVWLSLSHQTGVPDHSEAVLQVRDNGIGLAADQLSAIFELFVQVDNSLARSKGGLGLGLTIVRRLVEMHGGRVEAQSEGIGKGSSFTVHLPIPAAAVEQAAKPTQQAPDSPAPQRILVVDDNVDAAMTLGMLLKLKGYEVHTRTSGRAGLEAAEALQPAAILLDIGMPDLDGYATCRLLREQPWGRDMLVIAVSGYGQAEDRQRASEAGFNGHIVKPVELGALIKLLTDLLDKGGRL